MLTQALVIDFRSSHANTPVFSSISDHIFPPTRSSLYLLTNKAVYPVQIRKYVSLSRQAGIIGASKVTSYDATSMLICNRGNGDRKHEISSDEALRRNQ